jgi:hypothetical protein
MMRPPQMKRAAVLRLLRKGLVTHQEAADLAATTKRTIQDWALRERIDIATARATYLLKVWQAELAEERANRSTKQELMTSR